MLLPVGWPAVRTSGGTLGSPCRDTGLWVIGATPSAPFLGICRDLVVERVAIVDLDYELLVSELHVKPAWNAGEGHLLERPVADFVGGGLDSKSSVIHNENCQQGLRIPGYNQQRVESTHWENIGCPRATFRVSVL